MAGPRFRPAARRKLRGGKKDVESGEEEEIYWEEGDGRFTNDDPAKQRPQTAEKNEDATVVGEDGFSGEAAGRAEDGASGDESGGGSIAKKAPPSIERDGDGNPTRYSCGLALEPSSAPALTELTVEFGYQVYFEPGLRPSDLGPTLSALEGRLIEHVAEASGLPTSADGDCPPFGTDDGRRRLVRRSLGDRQGRAVDIVAVGAGDADREDEVNEHCVDTDDESVGALEADAAVDCVPISGSVSVQIAGTDEVGAANFVKSSARAWMGSYGSDRDGGGGATVSGVAGLAFLGTRTDDPGGGGGKGDFVDRNRNNNGPSAILAGPEPMVDERGFTDLGVAFAASLCLALVLILIVGGRKVRRRCSSTDSSEYENSSIH